MSLSAEVSLHVQSVQVDRAPWLSDEEVEEEWPVSEKESKVVSLDDSDPNEDTRPFSRVEVDAAINSGRVTIKFPAVLPPPSSRR